MTEEIKNENRDCLKGFLLMVLASFLGTLVALCLFSAAVKPQFPPQPMMQGPCPIQKMHHPNFNKRHENFERHNRAPIPPAQKPPVENK